MRHPTKQIIGKKPIEEDIVRLICVMCSRLTAGDKRTEPKHIANKRQPFEAACNTKCVARCSEYDRRSGADPVAVSQPKNVSNGIQKPAHYHISTCITLSLSLHIYAYENTSSLKKKGKYPSPHSIHCVVLPGRLPPAMVAPCKESILAACFGFGFAVVTTV